MSTSSARCLHLSRHEGDESGADFPMRTIIADAREHGSAGIVLAHNHPSGDARPSDSDCRATRRLATAAEALDCTVLDHLVFGGEECTSLRAARLPLGSSQGLICSGAGRGRRQPERHEIGLAAGSAR